MKYEIPEIQIVKLDVEDVITTSPVIENPEGGRGWG